MLVACRAVLTTVLTKVKVGDLLLRSLQGETCTFESDLVARLKALIINNSAIVETSSELILTSSELISTSSELIPTIGEKI